MREAWMPPVKVEVPLPCTTKYCVVVAAPPTVSPPAAAPVPTEDEALEMKPPVMVVSPVTLAAPETESPGPEATVTSPLLSIVMAFAVEVAKVVAEEVAK